MEHIGTVLIAREIHYLIFIGAGRLLSKNNYFSLGVLAHDNHYFLNGENPKQT